MATKKKTATNAKGTERLKITFPARFPRTDKAEVYSKISKILQGKTLEDQARCRVENRSRAVLVYETKSEKVRLLIRLDRKYTYDTRIDKQFIDKKAA